jgi:hypothetical protein
MLRCEFIDYQGERLRVFVVRGAVAVRGAGMDWLLRDETGRYYLRREIHDDTRGTIYARRTGQGEYRCFIHRVNVAGAILWQVAFGADRTLRRQARKMLAPRTECSLHGQCRQVPPE